MKGERPRRLGANYGRGLAMGTADAIPGVSGGTVALVLGIYEALIRALRGLVSLPAAALASDGRAGPRARAVEWSLLLPLGAGILTALAAGSVVIPPLLDAYPAETRALFFGLVAGSIALPWRRIDRVRARHVALAAGGAALAFALVGIPPREVADPNGLQVLGAAAVAVCAMILPGVSGAFLLEAFGLYATSLEALRAVDVGYVAVFAAGAVLGLAAFVKLLSWLLDRRHDDTMAALVGLMAGALRALWPWLEADRSLAAPPAEPGVAVVAVLALAGLGASVALLRAGRRRAPAGTP